MLVNPCMIHHVPQTASELHTSSLCIMMIIVSYKFHIFGKKKLIECLPWNVWICSNVPHQFWRSPLLVTYRIICLQPAASMSIGFSLLNGPGFTIRQPTGMNPLTTIFSITSPCISCIDSCQHIDSKSLLNSIVFKCVFEVILVHKNHPRP